MHAHFRRRPAPARMADAFRLVMSRIENAARDDIGRCFPGIIGARADLAPPRPNRKLALS